MASHTKALESTGTGRTNLNKSDAKTNQ